MPVILFVEDAADLAQIVRRELEEAGFTLALAEDGETGLQLFAQLQPDLIILDWRLPRLDGMELLRQIRRSSAVPVLMLTARDAPIDRVVGLEAGADDYLVKPFNLMELVARVRALLRRAERVLQMMAVDQSHASQALCWRGLRLDPDGYQAWLDEHPLDLTPLEFELLHLLLRSPGRTFNRMYLAETIWKQPFVEGDRSVDNTILRLRKKLGPLGEAVETVRGVGYRLKPEKSPHV